MHPYIRFATEKLPEMVMALREMVECESPSDSPADVNRFVDLMIDRTKDIAIAKVIKAEGCGHHLRLEFRLGPRRKTGAILGLGHSDTVWPLGTLKRMPFMQADGRLWGPGVLDMKSGLIGFLYAVRTLRELDVPLSRKIALFVVSDEEIGSQMSRGLTETEAKSSDYVLVLEPGQGLTGKLKTARKGIGTYRVWVTGKPAHAGENFANGESAILEAARQVQAIAAWTDLERGITLNPGVITGGTRRNVIAAEARIDVDTRAVHVKDLNSIDRKFRSLKSVNKRCTLRIEGGITRPPMERTKASVEFFAKARKIAEKLELNLEESSSGGGSDGNFTAALGVPTLDGLGGVGEGAHASNESIFIDRLPDRTALLAALLSGL